MRAVFISSHSPTWGGKQRWLVPKDGDGMQGRKKSLRLLMPAFCWPESLRRFSAISSLLSISSHDFHSTAVFFSLPQRRHYYYFASLFSSSSFQFCSVCASARGKKRQGVVSIFLTRMKSEGEDGDVFVNCCPFPLSWREFSLLILRAYKTNRWKESNRWKS